MKTLALQKLSSILFVLLIAFLMGCKKIDNTRYTPENKSNKTIKEIVFSGSLDASKGMTQISPDKTVQRYLVPIKSDKTTFYKYYLFESTVAGKYEFKTYVITKSPMTKGVDLFSIPISREGVTAYDIENKIRSSSKLMLKQHGKEIDLNGTLDNSKKPDEEFVMNNANPGENESGYCIDHWWVTYDTETGETLSIEYIGSDCYGCMVTNTCGGGGGGGGGNEEPPSCTQLLENFVSQGNAVSVKLGEMDISNNGTVWKKQYRWKIFEAGLYIVTSVEEGTLEKKPYKTNIGNTLYRWEFLDFVHKNTNATGTNAGGTREVKDVTGTSNISPTRLTAGMELTYTIESKILGINGGCAFLQTFTVETTWAAPNNNVIIVPQQ